MGPARARRGGLGVAPAHLVSLSLAETVPLYQAEGREHRAKGRVGMCDDGTARPQVG